MKKARATALFGILSRKRGSDDDAAYRDEPVAPVGLHVLPAYGLAAAGAVDEGIVARIDAGVQTAGAAAGPEDHDVAGPGRALGHGIPGPRLVHGHARDLEAVLAVGPPDEARAVEPAGRGGPAHAVLLAFLAGGRAHDVLGPLGIVVAGIGRLEHGTARCAAQDQGQKEYLKKTAIGSHDPLCLKV